MAVVKTSTSGKLECYAWRSHSRRESISTDTSEDRDGAEQMEKESSAPSVTHFLPTSVLSSSVPCLPFRPPTLLSLILTHQDQAYPGELRSPELQSGWDPSGPACPALCLLSNGLLLGSWVTRWESWGGGAWGEMSLAGWDPALPTLRVPHCPVPSSSQDFSSWTTVVKPVPLWIKWEFLWPGFSPGPG
nr:uncharacterized protein LOC118973507 isoform X2 [Manis javanica]